MKEKEELDTKDLTVWERLEKLEADVKYLKEITWMLDGAYIWPPDNGGR